MNKITWQNPCFVCGKPITRGRPTLVFSTVYPNFVGVRHSKCPDKSNLNHYDGFQMHPPDYLSNEQVSFLKYFYPKLFSLPGGEERNRELRWCAAYLLYDFPKSIYYPMDTYHNFLVQQRQWHYDWLYDGDFERDFFLLLGEIQRLAKDKPLDVEADFGRK